MLRELGFEALSIRRKEKSEEIVKGWGFKAGVEYLVFSADIRARKPMT